MKKSTFFDYLNRRSGAGFEELMAASTEDEDYINWNGYVLPNHYGDAEAEYTAIRESCAIFDGSPFPKIHIGGSGCHAFFERLLTRPVNQLPAMRATYVVFCNEDGTLKDDAILYKFGEDDFLMMPSDIDHTPYFESMREQYGIADVSFEQCGNSLAGLAIQGPRSAAALIRMGFDGVEMLRPFEVCERQIDGGYLRISRVGFTADLGYECWFAPDMAGAMMQRIDSAKSALNLHIPGYGLDAVQACRLEGGFIVAGWDCATELDSVPGLERTPYELGLGWLVDLDAKNFVGRDALAEQIRKGPRYALRTLEIDDQVQLVDGTSLYANDNSGGEPIGIATSSSWSWGLKRTIGNASVRSQDADTREAWAEIDGRRIAVKLSRGAPLKPRYRNQVPAPVDF